MTSPFDQIISVFLYTWTTIQLLYHTFRKSNNANPEPTASHHMQPSTLIDRPHWIPFTVPYPCVSSPYDYDPRGFWDFPTRAGWALDPTGYRDYRNERETMEWAEDLAPLDALYDCRRRMIPESLSSARPRDALRLKCYRIVGGGNGYRLADVSEQVAFLQAWLFFGMLEQVSSICGVDARLEEEFILQGLEVSTAPLDRLVRSWLEAKLDPERAVQIVRVVQHVLSMQTRYEDPRKQQSQALTYAECRVLLSIRVATRAVLLALAMSGVCEPGTIRSLMDPQIQQSFPAWWDGLKEFARGELLREGWCRSECKLLERMDGCYEFFATGLTRPRMDHGQCDDFRCLADQVNEGTYRTVHVEPECGCAQVIVDQEELRAILQRGKIPRVMVSDDYRLSVVESGPYIAISHVWSHGLGNPVENALPLCQIRRLSQHIARVASMSGVTGQVALWMDTFCIPVADNLRDYRKQAIVLLRETYRNATAVLVLDRELEKLDTERTSLLEQELHMSFIGWMRRLWTLQEGALAQKLYFQTFRGPCLTGKVHGHVGTETEMEQLISKICFREDIEELMSNRIPPLETMQKSTFETSDSATGFPAISEASTSYQRLCFAVKHRSTSKIADEAIILATIIGAETKDFVEMHDIDSRMSLFHTLMREIPSDIIFANIERISRAPFRWAPRSLLNFSTFRVNSFGPPGKCDARGLHATYEGFVPIGRSGSGYEPEDGKYYAEDTSTGIKYTFIHYKDQHDVGGTLRLPERPTFIFRYYGIDGDVAVVNILGVAEDGDLNEATHVPVQTTDVITPSFGLAPAYEVTIVGHLKLVASGGSWGIDGEPAMEQLQGTMTKAEQRWLIT